MKEIKPIIVRMDDMGRIVIPKEIRRELNLKEGYPLRVSLSEDNEIVISKHTVKKPALDCMNELENILRCDYNGFGSDVINSCVGLLDTMRKTIDKDEEGKGEGEIWEI